MMNTAQLVARYGDVALTDSDKVRLLELQARGVHDLRATGDLKEYQDLRLRNAQRLNVEVVAADDSEHAVEGDAGSDSINWVPDVHSFFVNGRNAPTFAGTPVTGMLAVAMHARLFGKDRRQRAFGAHWVRRLRCSGTDAGCGRTAQVRSRPRERRDGSRRHSTRGSTKDSAGGSSPSDLPAPQKLERTCAICGVDISDKNAGAQTCDGPNGPHKRQWHRERKRRAAQAELPDHTACSSCGRRWLSDENPKDRACPRCNGVLQIGANRRPESIAADPLRHLYADDDRFEAALSVPKGTTWAGLWSCIYDNRGLNGHLPQPERAGRPVRRFAVAQDSEPLLNLVDLTEFRRRHERFVRHLAAQATSRLEVAA